MSRILRIFAPLIESRASSPTRSAAAVHPDVSAPNIVAVLMSVAMFDSFFVSALTSRTSWSTTRSRSASTFLPATLLIGTLSLALGEDRDAIRIARRSSPACSSSRAWRCSRGAPGGPRDDVCCGHLSFGGRSPSPLPRSMSGVEPQVWAPLARREDGPDDGGAVGLAVWRLGGEPSPTAGGGRNSAVSASTVAITWPCARSRRSRSLLRVWRSG